MRYQIHDFLAQIAIESGDFQEALEQIHLVIIGRFHYFHMPEDVSVYIRIPRQMFYCEARIALAKKDPAAALAAGNRVADIDPEDLDLVLQLVAAFKQNGYDKEADQLRTHNRELLEGILKTFPKSQVHRDLLVKLEK